MCFWTKDFWIKDIDFALFYVVAVIVW
jgi:hypothetical protein